MNTAIANAKTISFLLTNEFFNANTKIINANKTKRKYVGIKYAFTR